MPKKYILEGIQLEIDDEFLNKVKENKQVKSINKNHKEKMIGNSNVDNQKPKKRILDEYTKDKKLEGDTIYFTKLVNMKVKEYEDLVSLYGKELTEKCIKILHDYKKKYKKSNSNNSDYRSIKMWVIDTVKQRIKFWNGD